MIVPLKKAIIICLKEQKNTLLDALQKCGELMLITDDLSTVEADGKVFEECRRTDSVLKQITPYRKKAGFLTPLPEVSESEFCSEDPSAVQLRAQLEEAAAAVDSLAKRSEELSAAAASLEPWLNLTVPVDQTGISEYTAVIPVLIPASKPEIADALRNSCPSLVVEDYSVPKCRQAALLLFCSRDHYPALTAAMKDCELTLPDFAFNGLPSDEYARINAEYTANEEALSAARQQLSDLAAGSGKVELLFEQKTAEYQRTCAPVILTDETCFIQGWVRSDRTEKLRQCVTGVCPVSYISFEDPSPDEDVPVVTQNSKFVSQFESVTNMFARPSRLDIDPNPVMSVWYWIIFGMMMADVGYGVLMIVLLGLFKAIKKPRGNMLQLVNTMQYSGITTIIFGVVFGSYFGYELFPPLWVSTIEQPIMVLIMAVIVGVLHLFTGMILNIVKQCKNGQPLDGILDNVPWIMIISGAGMLFLPSLSTVGAVIAGIGALTVLFTAGRAKKGIFGKVLGGLGALYGATSYLSDILSYSRIMALGLSSAVIGYVMNMMAGMIFNALPIVINVIAAGIILLIGHAFNIVMGLLSAYVHDGRLQYIEFFGKFYEGGGKEFSPFSVNTGYLVIKDKKG